MRRVKSSHSSKQEKSVDTEIIINEGAENETAYEVRFNRKTEWSHDSNYGADADGNRGIPMTFIDEDYAVDISVNDSDIKDYPSYFQEEIKKEINHWLELNLPEEEERGEY